MKRMTLIIVALLFTGLYSYAKDTDDSKLAIMEELGLTNHVDPFQYNRQHKKFAQQKAASQTSTPTKSAKLVDDSSKGAKRRVANAGSAQ